MPDDLEVEIGADIKEFQRKVDQVEREIIQLDHKFNGIELGGKGAGAAGFAGIGGQLGIAAQGLAAFLAVATGSNAIGILAGGAGALVSQLTAAASGLVGYGAVAIPILTDLFGLQSELADAQKRITDADTTKERKEALKAYKELYDKLSGSQKKALDELKEFKKFWGEFTKQFEDPVFEAFSKTLDVTQQILEEMEPVISLVSDHVVTLLDALSKNIESDDMQEFFNFLGTTAVPALDNLTRAGGNFLVGFMSLMEAFGPLGEDFSEGFLQMSEDFRKWADTIEDNPKFQEFVDWVRENTPELLDTLGEISEYLLKLGEKLADIGGPVLEFIGWLAKMQNDGLDKIEDFKETLKGLDWSDLLTDLGEDLLEGLIDGIFGKKDDLMDVAWGIAHAVQSTLMSALDIHSPSRVMMKLGGYVGDGLAIGMEDSISRITDASNSLANAAAYGGFSTGIEGNEPSTTESKGTIPLQIPVILNGREIAVASVDDLNILLGQKKKDAGRRVGVR